jgi:hypothetical protein
MNIGTLTGQLEIEDELSSRLTMAARSVAAFASEFSALSKTVVLGGSAIIGAIGGISGVIIGLGNRGADVNDVAATFENFSGSVDIAKASLDKMREGTLGTVTDFDLMKTASKLLAGDVKLTSGQFGDLSRAAFILQNQGLGPTKDMLDLVSQAMLTGRTRSLEMRIGKIDLEKATKELAKTLGVEVSQLNEAGRTAARQNAILNALNRKVKEAGAQQRDFGEQMEFAVTKIKNWGDELARRVASSSAVTDAVNKIGKALVDNFGGAGQSAIEVIVSWIDRFAKGVAYYGPIIIKAVSDIANWIYEVWKSIRKSWDDAPEWFKRMTIAAGGATLAIKGTQLAVETITGADILTNVASAATIWSGFGNAIIKTANALKTFAAVSVLTVQIGGISALVSGLGSSIAGLAASLVSIPALATAAFVGLGIGIWKVAGAIDAAAKSSESWWEILTRKDDDNWLRRMLGLTTELKGLSEAQAAQGTPQISPGYISGGAAAARQRDEMLNLAQGYGGAVKDFVKTNDEFAQSVKKLRDQISGAEVVKDMKTWVEALKQPGLVAKTLADTELRGRLGKALDEIQHKFGSLKAAGLYSLEPVQKSLKAFSDHVETIPPGIEDMLDPFTEVSARTYDWAAANVKTTDGIKTMVKEWKVFKFEKPEKVFEGIRTTSDKVYDSLGNIGDILDSIPGKFAEIGAMAARAGQAIMENLAKGDWVGALIAGATAAVGIFGKLFGFGDTDYEKRTKKAAEDMRTLTRESIKAAGSMQRLATNARMVGINIQGAFDSKDPEFLSQILDEVKNKTDKLNGAMQEYGFTWMDTAQEYRNAALGDLFDQLLEKTNLLKGAGINYEEILSRQSGQYSELLQQALKTNTEIPISMKQTLEDLMKMGKLVDENGNQFEDLEDVTWAKTMTQGFGEVTDAIHELTDALLNGVGGAIDNLNKRKVHIQTQIDSPDLSSRGVEEPSYYAKGGTVVNFRPRGSDTVPAMLTPGERVIPRGGGGGTAIFELNGRKVAEIVVPEIPGAVKRLGIR